MNDSLLKDEQPLLTTADVHRWEAQKTQLETVLKDTEFKLAEIDKKLEAAALFMPRAVAATGSGQELLTQEPHQDQEISNGESETVPLTWAVLSILAKSNKSLRPMEIRAELERDDRWQARLGENASYLYTTISRLERRKKIAKRQGKYRVAQ